MNFVNLTPHVIRLNDGTEIQPTAPAARVNASHSNFDHNNICTVNYGRVENLPAPKDDTMYIVSLLVAQGIVDHNHHLNPGNERVDVVYPATGHPECIRKDGQVYSVPGFVRYF